MVKSKDDSRRKYINEPLARAAILDGLNDRFEFVEEVEAVGAGGDAFRIDAVCRCVETGWSFGWEFKRSHLFKKEFAAALRQAIHYRHAQIVDKRLADIGGSQLAAIALFPDWLGEHDDDTTNHGQEAEGMRLLAAQFRVGTMRENSNGSFTFIMGQSGIWHSASGWTNNAKGVLFGKCSLGAVRRKDV